MGRAAFSSWCMWKREATTRIRGRTENFVRRKEFRENDRPKAELRPFVGAYFPAGDAWLRLGFRARADSCGGESGERGVLGARYAGNAGGEPGEGRCGDI